LAVKLVQDVLGKTIPETDVAALEAAVQDPKVCDKILEGLAKVAKKNKLNGWVLTRRVKTDTAATSSSVVSTLASSSSRMTSSPLPSRSSGELSLTPSVRCHSSDQSSNVAAQRFKEQIDAMYNKIEGGAKL
jgi:hypothetical protein